MCDFHSFDQELAFVLGEVGAAAGRGFEVWIFPFPVCFTFAVGYSLDRHTVRCLIVVFASQSTSPAWSAVLLVCAKPRTTRSSLLMA